jgi:acetylornithine/N-succinyldiaminopimelate aminotransferase
MNPKTLFCNFLGQTSGFPLALEIDRAEGLYMWGTDGKRYLDLISGISVSNVGHCHPRVVKAVQEQAQKYMHLMVYGELVQSPQVQLAYLLSQNLPENLNNVYFVNSGSEAVEGAVKLAKRYTGRFEVIAFKNAYHGSTQGSLSIMGDETMKNAFRPLLPGVKFLEFNSFDDLDQINQHIACVIMETIQGEAGAIVPEEGFIKAVSDQCKKHGALLILDEIQSGYGRTGSLWAFEKHGVSPDILTLAKGMGGGMPIGAFISSKEIMHSLTHDPVLGHITTFGGNAVCAAAAMANLEVILENKLWENAARQERRFRELLVHPRIKRIRGKGLMLALEFESFQENKKIIDKLIERGILTDWFLFAPHCLRIAPPLIIDDESVETSCKMILDVLDLQV